VWLLEGVASLIKVGQVDRVLKVRELTKNPKSGMPGLFEMLLYCKLTIQWIFQWTSAVEAQPGRPTEALFLTGSKFRLSALASYIARRCLITNTHNLTSVGGRDCLLFCRGCLAVRLIAASTRTSTSRGSSRSLVRIGAFAKHTMASFSDHTLA
jgi:hypothetical protein